MSIKRVLAYGATLVIGIGFGASARGEEPTKPISTPKPEVITKEVEVVKEVPGPERIVEKVVTKEVTPAVCLRALDMAQEGFSYAAEFANITSRAFFAASRMDVRGMERAEAEMGRVNAKIEALAPKVAGPVAECRSKA